MYRYLFTVTCDCQSDVDFEYIARNLSIAYQMLLNDFRDSSYSTFTIEFYRVSKKLVNPVYQTRCLPTGYGRDFIFDSSGDLEYIK